MDNMSIFDLLPEDEAKKYKPIKSTDWKWSFKDYPKEKNGLKVFSCFACGGGSTMGYKFAGCEVVGCCEIDPKMNKVYVENHNPKYNYLMDIRKFNEIPNEELPQELFNLDILDGSPPCTTFSMAGEREKSWGKKKKFREGQTEQTLDDLSFIFIDTVKKLRPKVMIMENVEGLLLGEAWNYVQKIYAQLHEIGYQVKHWLCKGENMGVPQKRHRVFFIALRQDVNYDITDLDMSFNYKPITFGEIQHPIYVEKRGKLSELAKMATHNDKSLLDVNKRINGKKSFFSENIVWKDKICPTLVASKNMIWVENTGCLINDTEIKRIQTFPQDYNFGKEKAIYVCGMSVPPIMIKRIVTRLIESGVFDVRA